MGLIRRLRTLFSSSALDDEAVMREEYGLDDRGEAELRRDRFGSFGTGEAAEAAEDELQEFEPPRDASP
jgi:hypothetical protein